MSDEIINRVANSGLITVDLANYAPNLEILELDLKQFLFEGYILKENDFRSSIRTFDFSIYKNKVTAILCSSNCIIPMWAFMLVASELNNVTSEFYSGNKESVFQKLFLNNIEKINPIKFKNKKVIIKGCSQISIQETLYVAITKKLKNHVASLMFGEACSAVPIYKKKK